MKTKISHKIIILIISLLLILTSFVPCIKMRSTKDYTDPNTKDVTEDYCARLSAFHFIKYGLFKSDKLEKELESNLDKVAEKLQKKIDNGELSEEEAEEEYIKNWYFNASYIYYMKDNTTFKKLPTLTKIYSFVFAGVYGITGLIFVLTLLSLIIPKGNFMRGFRNFLSFLTMLGGIGMIVCSFFYKESFPASYGAHIYFGVPLVTGYIIAGLFILNYVLALTVNKKIKKNA